MLITRQTCRSCGSSALSPVVSLGEQFLASNFAITDQFPAVQRRIPLELVRCDPSRDERACGLVQLRHTVPGDLMYSCYGYRSGINDTMRQHLGTLARGVEKRVGLRAGDLVVDIGANDGTTLLAYETPGAVYVGFEPSNIQPEVPTPHIRFIKDWFSAASLRTHTSASKAKIVTSIAMFYDLEEPNRFVADVAEILADDGLWVVEMAYLPLTIENNSFDTICHEHLEYYSLSAIEKLLHRHGIEIVDCELNDANGGSIRVTACKRGSVHAERSDETASRIYRIKKREFEMELDTEAPYRAFGTRIEKVRDDLRSLLEKLRASGKKVYGYGASTKGNVILQYAGLGPDLVTAIADRNPAKWGGVTLGTDIPIVSEEDMRAAKPDYLLVLPWHFLREFVKRESAFVERGGKFIVPLPDVRLVP
jgi:hypothetical protein